MLVSDTEVTTLLRQALFEASVASIKVPDLLFME